MQPQPSLIITLLYNHLRVVKHDVWFPDEVLWETDGRDISKLLRIPHQIFVLPHLNQNDQWSIYCVGVRVRINGVWDGLPPSSPVHSIVTPNPQPFSSFLLCCWPSQFIFHNSNPGGRPRKSFLRMTSPGQDVHPVSCLPCQSSLTCYWKISIC